MTALVFDTSCPAAVVGLVVDGAVQAERTLVSPKSHAERLAGLIEDVLAEAGAARTDLDEIVVGRGPGSFIGTRVALATAAGLSLATGAPLVGVCTVLAVAASEPGDGRVLALIDARKAEVYRRLVTWEAGAVRALDEARASSPSDAAAEAASCAAAIGATHLIQPPPTVRLVPRQGPNTIGLWRAARAPDARRGDVVLPNYCRAPDAKLPAGARPA